MEKQMIEMCRRMSDASLFELAGMLQADHRHGDPRHCLSALMDLIDVVHACNHLRRTLERQTAPTPPAPKKKGGNGES